MTRELGVEKVAPMVDEFFRACADIVVDHDGIVDHFLGDAIMAFFNVPIKQEDHVARAVTTAAQIQLACTRLKSREILGEPLKVGIGISSGLGYVDAVGSNSCKDYTVLGEAVNIASRLQGQAEPGEVVVTEEVYEAVRTAFPNAIRREYQLKGIKEPITAYVLT